MRKICRLLAAALVLLFALTAGGCSGVEPEKRCYPLVLGADYQAGEFQILYGMANLSVSTGQDKAQEKETSPSLLEFQAPELEQVEEDYGESQEKYLDLGHLQAVIFGEGLIESGKWRELLRYYRSNPAVGEDIYLFQTGDMKGAMALNDQMDASLGEYLTGIYENRPDGPRKDPVTLRQAYESCLEGTRLPRLPALEVAEGRISVKFTD